MNNRDLLVGAGLGAAVTLMFDPQVGGRRRALVRDKLVWSARKTRDGIDATARDITHRARGIAAATRGRISEDIVDDDTLVERVRARLGRVCSHPHAVDVYARDGEIALRGPILANEADRVVGAIGRVRGVRAVLNELTPYERANSVPSLQGRGREPGSRIDLFQRHWAPATRALVGATALASGIYAMAHARRAAP